jgi:hypothetical protein
MSDGSSSKGLRDRLASGTEDRLGRALSDLLENPLLNGALGRAADAREKATQAQELAMGALNLPSAADVERLTRRLRSVSLRLEGIEDGVHRLGRVLPGQALDDRLAAIEEQLRTLSRTVGDVREGLAAKRAAGGTAQGGSAAAKKASGAGAAKASSGATAGNAASGSAKRTASAGGRRATKPAAAKRTAAKPSAATRTAAKARPANAKVTKG